MIQSTPKHKRGKEWKKVIGGLILLLGNITAQAQQGSTGNTYIFGNAEMTFFGTHTFANGGSGTLPGIVGTARAPQKGILNFASTAPTPADASDEAHVDGYVRKYGSSSFIFPTGDNGRLGAFAAAADGTMGAYYFDNPTTAVTSNLEGGNYTALPSGGPFPITQMEAGVLNGVSPIEYWDIDGTSPTKITLTWDNVSDISTLTNNELSYLTIAGWDGTQWVAIPSKVDETALLGGTSSLTSGSITTISTLTPSTYTAYTFASRDTPLPVTLTAFNVIAEGGNALLQWSTIQETNSDFFVIEHSSKGNNWSKIGQISAKGESSSFQNYQFIHMTPVDGQNLYRLKMVDQDGTSTNSPMRSLVVKKDQLAIFPNPAISHIRVPYQATAQHIEIMNLQGNVLQQVKKQHVSEEQISVAHLKEGVYLVRTTNDEGVQRVYRFIKTSF